MTSKNKLDHLDKMREIDREQMLAHIDALADQFQNAWNAAQTYLLPDSHRSPRRIVLCGMGGSAIGGSLVAALVSETAPVPFDVVRGYTLPAYVAGPDTLVIASSHSGNTEETLAATAQAHERGARILAITTGGELAEFATANGYPLWQFDYQSQPRAALGWSFGLLLGLAHRLNLASTLENDLDEAVMLLREQQARYTATVPEELNSAKLAAQLVFGRVPVVFGSGIFEPIAQRWKGQLNENAKIWAQYEPLPEMNHNAIASVTFPREQKLPFAGLFIRSQQFDHARVALRYDLTVQMCLANTFSTFSFEPEGRSALAQMCHAIQYGDYLSYYAAILYKKDPTAIEQILELKSQLARR